MRLLPALLLATSLVAPAQAQSRLPCGPHEVLVKALEERFEEKVSFLGGTSQGHLLEIVLSKRGSWTILITTPTGVSCLIADGDAWTPKDHDPEA